MGSLELVKIQTVETNQAFICPNPEITIGSLSDGRYRSARQTSRSSPRVMEILRHGPSGVDRRRRNREAESRKSGNGKPE